ncbi:unnamed protein product, partial [Ceratitis capitata]
PYGMSMLTTSKSASCGVTQILSSSGSEASMGDTNTFPTQKCRNPKVIANCQVFSIRKTVPITRSGHVVRKTGLDCFDPISVTMQGSTEKRGLIEEIPLSASTMKRKVSTKFSTVNTYNVNYPYAELLPNRGRERGKLMPENISADQRRSTTALDAERFLTQINQYTNTRPVENEI